MNPRCSRSGRTPRYLASVSRFNCRTERHAVSQSGLGCATDNSCHSSVALSMLIAATFNKTLQADSYGAGPRWLQDSLSPKASNESSNSRVMALLVRHKVHQQHATPTVIRTAQWSLTLGQHMPVGCSEFSLVVPQLEKQIWWLSPSPRETFGHVARACIDHLCLQHSSFSAPFISAAG